MPIAQVGTTQQTQQDTSSTTPSVTWPAGVQAGHYAVLQASMNSITAPGSLPSGFTLQATSLSSANQSTTPQTRIWTKPCDGTETGSLTVPTPSTTSKIQLEVWSGVDPTSPLDIAAVGTGFGATSIFDFAITPVTPGCLVSWVAAANDAVGVWSSSTSGVVETMDDASPVATTGMERVVLAAAGAVTINMRLTTSVRGSLCAVVLRPAPDLPIIVLPPRR